MRTHDDFLEALATQLKALQRSCEGFDRGDHWEAARMATSIHIIVHDGNRNTTSLLSRLGIRGQLRFATTSPGFNPANLVTSQLLTCIRIEEGKAWYEPRGMPSIDTRREQFAKWWEEVVIAEGNGGPIISRKSLVFSLRDQDGGSHFDAKLTDDAYRRATTENSARWMMNGKPLTEPAVHFATMRQIAEELLFTLAPYAR